MTDGSARDLQLYVEELEWRLREHHHALNEAIEQRDRLAIDAAWGVASWLRGALLAVAVFGGAYYWLPHHWVTAVVAVIAAHVAFAVGWISANTMRAKEVESFWRLPQWEGRSPL